MTLENLLAIHRLQPFDATPAGLQRLLASAERNLADAQLPQLSADNRFDMAYKTIIQCAMIGLWANGYVHRPASRAIIRPPCKPCQKPWGSNKTS